MRAATAVIRVGAVQLSDFIKSDNFEFSSPVSLQIGFGRGEGEGLAFLLEGEGVECRQDELTPSPFYNLPPGRGMSGADDGDDGWRGGGDSAALEGAGGGVARDGRGLELAGGRRWDSRGGAADCRRRGRVPNGRRPTERISGNSTG